MDNTYQKYLTLIIPYSIGISTLYLFGYWGSFNINIFEYIGISDVLKIAIYQLIHYGSLILLGVVTAHLFINPVMSKALPPGEGAELPETKFIKKYWRFLAIIPFSLIIYITLFTNSETRWLAAALLIAPLSPFIVGNSTFLSDLIPNTTARNTIAYLGLMIFILSYGWGTVDAARKKAMDNNVSVNGGELKKTYIGRAGDHIFFWDKENSMVEILLTESVKSVKYQIPQSKPLFSFTSAENEE